METKTYCNEEVYELLDGPYAVKYNKFKILQWVGRVWMILECKKKTEWKISLKNTSWKTTAEMGRQPQEGLLLAAEH